MARFSALLDACVLVPIAQADALLRLAERGMFRPLWSQRILDETAWAINEIHPDISLDKARRRGQQMNNAFPDACVKGWEGLVGAIQLPDPDDRHVVAAAIRGRADVIVTNNLRDFPPEALKPCNLEAQTANTFLLNQLDLEPTLTMHALADQATGYKNPPVQLYEVLHRLARCGASDFADAAAQQMWRIG